MKNRILQLALTVCMIALPSIINANILKQIHGTWIPLDTVDKRHFTHHSFKLIEENKQLSWAKLSALKYRSVKLRIQLVSENEIRATNAIYEESEGGHRVGGGYLTIEQIDEHTISVSWFRESSPKNANQNFTQKYTLKKTSNEPSELRVGESVERHVAKQRTDPTSRGSQFRSCLAP